eukprot:m.86606 g.86606  ORF g.86606 m.86606 type:complete len:298 (+) comp12814_c0_seq3:1638-2531(+)
MSHTTNTKAQDTPHCVSCPCIVTFCVSCLTLLHGFVSIGDASPLPIVAAQSMPVATVYGLEPDAYPRHLIEEVIPDEVEDRIFLLPASATTVTDTMIDTKVDLIIGEPSFSSSLVPWHNLHFWYAASAMKPFCVDATRILPNRAWLVVMAVRFAHLHTLRLPVQNVCDFDLQDYDGSAGDFTWEAHNVREFEYTAVTKPIQVLEFPLEDSLKDLEGVVPISEDLLASADASGEVNALVAWMDYGLTDSITVTSHPEQCEHGFQGVLMLPPTTVVEAGTSRFQANFAQANGQVTLALV